MTDDEILDRLRAIFSDVFGQPVPLTIHTEASEIPNWDSMAQVTLTVEIEREFHVAIRSAEMERLRSLRELVGLIRLRSPEVVAR